MIKINEQINVPKRKKVKFENYICTQQPRQKAGASQSRLWRRRAPPQQATWGCDRRRPPRDALPPGFTRDQRRTAAVGTVQEQFQVTSTNY